MNINHTVSCKVISHTCLTSTFAVIRFHIIYSHLTDNLKYLLFFENIASVLILYTHSCKQKKVHRSLELTLVLNQTVGPFKCHECYDQSIFKQNVICYDHLIKTIATNC